jgi:hypothetical protein
MGIYWKKTSGIYPNGRYDYTYWTAFDPDVRFPAFHPETGDEPIGNVHREQGGLKAGL